MNKNDLIEHISGNADISKSQAKAALEAFVDAVTKSLKKKNDVAIVGFGTFSVSRRKARTGRNPQTGESIKIKAKNAPKFKPGATLRDAVN